MNVLIVAKTRRGKGACIGGITLDGQSVRLEAANAHINERAGHEFNIGEVWEVDARPAAQIIPPHVENVIVRSKRKTNLCIDLISFIDRYMPPQCGGPAALYQGLTQPTNTGALYIAERTGVPPFSTMFWRPDQDLVRDEAGLRIRYRYPASRRAPRGACTLTYVGFQEPLEVLPAGTRVRVSLAHWWSPVDRPRQEARCFVQLSGWFK